MMYSKEDKLNILKGLNWDYSIETIELLDVIEGRRESAGPFDRVQLFVRCLERMPWHRIAGLWGVELSEKMLNAETIGKVWIKSRREQLERLEKILRGEPLSFPEWSPELREKLRSTVFSDRWYSSKQRLL